MEDDMSTTGSSLDDSEISESAEQSAFEKQRVNLQTYLDSLPYECESIEEMQRKLEEIVGNIMICSKAKNWLLLTTWDSMLQCWLVMRYPMPKSTRAKLARFYYELCLMPGVEPRILRSWADMFCHLIASKPGSKPKLESHDLELQWLPLWRILQKELWPKKRIQDDSRNVVNILLYLAEESKRYFPPSEIPEMLKIFIPILTQDSVLTMIPILTSFLPPTHTHLYLPTLFKLWEAFNSAVIDERLCDLMGLLAEEHVASTSGPAGLEGGAMRKDVGMWTEAEWTLLMGKCLGSMNLPVGSNKGANSTAGHADTMGDRQSLRIKKTINKYNSFAQILVYSIFLDGSIRPDFTNTLAGKSNNTLPTQPTGYVAGSKALDSLERLVTSTESFFHPSNVGQWSLSLTTFLHRLTAEFAKRWKEEELPSCRTPVAYRLTPAIRRAFVTTLRTPTLLAMFSKDPVSMAYAQGALRTMALLEPALVMPQLLERAFGGLEVVNETHRTTAVLSMLSGVALPIVSEKIWVGGQRHLVPLLELCIPGIDMNDPIKTVCTTMFICNAIQHIKIGDLSMQQSGVTLSSDAPAEELMEVDGTEERLPDGVDGIGVLTFDKGEERALTRDSTAAFADWVTSFFRRVLALYENLPEEGGRRNMTGGKSEETILKSIKSTLDVVCLHLSDSLFDLVLKLVYEYATTNAKSNAVRAFMQLVSCMARVKPQQTLEKFLPFCVAQIQEELKHGASGIRTTASHDAVPSDTTLHWNLGILRGCMGYAGASLVKHRDQVLGLLALLVDKTKSERGYSSTGRLITRTLHTLAGVYPLNSRFVNSDEWDTAEFNADHNTQWGRLYEAKDVKIEWHVPSSDEIAFVIDILEVIASPALDKIEVLLENTNTWDSVSRNDFCRYLYAVRSVWSGLPTLFLEGTKEVANPCLHDETEVADLLVKSLDVKAGFTLTDAQDPRYQTVRAHRERFGNIVHRAALALRQNNHGEDHIDAVIGASKSIDVFLLEYGMSRGNYTALQKNFSFARDLNRVWSRQKENSRLVWIKRAQVYHSGRVYMHALYRRRSELDDRLFGDLVELSLSPYTRVRKHAQAVLHNACGYYVRSTRLILPTLFSVLAKGSDPDRMKGALYILWNKGTAAYALSDTVYHGQYLTSLLECQHQEKPSIQKIVSSVSQDSFVHLSEEALQTQISLVDNSRVEDAMFALEGEFSPSLLDQTLLAETLGKIEPRVVHKNRVYHETVASIIEIAKRPTTHWRYSETAIRFLYGLLRRDIPVSSDMARLLVENTISAHPTMRTYAQRAVIKMLAMVKIRTYSNSAQELWLDTWVNPLERSIQISDPSEFLRTLTQPTQDVFVEKVPTGFLVWKEYIKGYAVVKEGAPPLLWDTESFPALEATGQVLDDKDFFSNLATLWSQESNKNSATLELRMDNCNFVKTIAKMFEGKYMDPILAAVEPLWSDPDRFKQRAATEIISGLLRGSKHWPRQLSVKLWSWFRERLDQMFNQIKPDTLTFWENLFSLLLLDRDPRRCQPVVDWIFALPLDFHGDSAFTMSKTLALFGILVDCFGIRFKSMSDKYVHLFFDNAHTGYAEVRSHLATNFDAIMRCEWQPSYPSTEAFLVACSNSRDPLKIREAKYMDRITGILRLLPEWREERLPPPRVNQSQYDKVGLTLLHWTWTSFHGPQACLMFPYIIPMLPEILRMAELNDSSELQLYSSAVLYALSAVTPPPETIDIIASHFVDGIKSSKSWRIRLHALPTLVVFFYRSLMSFSSSGIAKVMDVLLECLADENVEVREMAARVLSGVLRCSQRQSIIPLKNRFVNAARKTRLPARSDPTYVESLRSLHSAILGICALVESFPYSVEPWLPPLVEILALHATDPPPISTTIRKCASEFKKTHQDTWHTDQQAFNEDQLQSLSNMLVGTSYYA